MTTASTIPARERRRLEAVWSLAARTECVASAPGFRAYSVPSQTRPDRYTVTLRHGARPRCECEAAAFGRVCVHAAAALLAREWWLAAALRTRFPVVCRATRKAA